MLKLAKVAVTGGLSSGKTTACQFFKELGAFVLSADEITHQLISDKSSQIINLLGHDVEKNGNLDRSLIAQKVFKNKTLLKKLEEILHPAVFQIMQSTYDNVVKNQNCSLFVVEIPLLFETGKEDWFDVSIYVGAPVNACIQRFCEKGGTKEEYFQRMESQMAPALKEAKAQFTITNDNDLNHFKSQVIQLFHVLTQEELHPK